MEVVYHRSFIQVGKLSHVVRFVEFGWVDFVDAFEIDFTLLQQFSKTLEPI